MISSLIHSRATIFFPLFDCLYTCSICISVLLRLDCGQVSDKRHIFRCSLIRGRRLLGGSGYSGVSINVVVRIRGRRLFESRRLLEEVRYCIYTSLLYQSCSLCLQKTHL